MERSFAAFVRENLESIDELSRRYADYRREVGQCYLMELRNNINATKPQTYTFVFERPEIF